MKSNDCHVFIQTLIPLAYRDLLLKGIWDALMEISHFFRDIYSSKLQTQQIESLQTNIVETICKLEMIFPPSFFWLHGASTHTFIVWGKSWRPGPVQMDVSIQEVRDYICNVIFDIIFIFFNWKYSFYSMQVFVQS
jgi:hypothetical protein